MVLPYLFGILVLLLLLAVVLILVVYTVTLPMFVQVWILEPFGDPSTLFPGLILLFGSILTVSVLRNAGTVPSESVKKRVVPGLLLSTVGAWVFAGAWAVLEKQHLYYESRDVRFTKPGSLCYDYVTACLLWGSTSPYGNQIIAALLGSALYYAGVSLWWNGFEEGAVSETLSGYRDHVRDQIEEHIR